ncbi:MAG: aminodeoxychorismate lyase [Pseudomonadota bacterium]|nr:aminodeoxychorismate lyase [Pseudomonadota bacterium]
MSAMSRGDDTTAVTTRVFVGDRPVAAVPPGDRGLAYGDGVFETMRAHAGTLPWWDAHWARLGLGAKRLGLQLPAPGRVLAEAEALLAGAGGVLKLVLTRGSGGRGYGPPEPQGPGTWMLALRPLPASAPATGIDLRWCRTRLAVQPALAGIKHCNRLEQVLARAEWASAPEAERHAHEGLMLSTEGDVVCATAANVFVLHGGQWTTPAVDRCGVAGVCRQWALERLDPQVRKLDPDEVRSADVVFLCNAVRGILGVARLGPREWAPHPQVLQLRKALASSHPGFSTPDTEVS